METVSTSSTSILTKLKIHPSASQLQVEMETEKCKSTKCFMIHDCLTYIHFRYEPEALSFKESEVRIEMDSNQMIFDGEYYFSEWKYLDIISIFITLYKKDIHSDVTQNKYISSFSIQSFQILI